MPGPRDLLHSVSARYPGAWRLYDDMRAQRGQRLPDWPAWCWCPLAGAYAIASGGRDLPMERLGDVALLGALSAWRVGQGIYRFDPEIFQAVVSTPLDDAVPWDHIYRLPEWCVYIETPGLRYGGRLVHGFFAHLESDDATGHVELRLLLDRTVGPLGIPLHVIPGGSIREGWGATLDDAAARLAARGMPNVLPSADEIPSEALQEIAQPTKTRHGLRSFPPDAPRVWHIGESLGRQIRAAREAAGVEGTHASPRAHLRRGHWHSYWVGPRNDISKRHLELRWLLPMLVGSEDANDAPETWTRMPAPKEIQ